MRLILEKEINISYSQIALFDHEKYEEYPFNDWSKIHLEQGFAWREGSVSFGTLDSCPAFLSVYTNFKNEEFDLSECIAIKVPLEISKDKIEIATIFDEPILLGIPSQRYVITYKNYIKKSAMYVDLIVSHSTQKEALSDFEILNTGSDIVGFESRAVTRTSDFQLVAEAATN